MSFIPRGKIVVSTVNAEGKGVFEPDRVAEVQDLPGGATLRRVYKLDQVPATGITYDTTHELGGISNKAGVEWVECEMPPGAKSPMHATPSIDLGIMITGEVTLILDSGEERVLKYVPETAAASSTTYKS